MSNCKYCHSNIKWIERKPFNLDGTSHTFDACTAIRLAAKRDYRAEKLAEAKYKRDKRKTMELGNATDAVSKFNNRRKINRCWSLNESNWAIEEANILRPVVEKYNLELVIQQRTLYAVAPDDTIVYVFNYYFGIPVAVDRANLNLKNFLEWIEIPEIRIAKSVYSPRRWALWYGDEERGEYSSKAIAEASLADLREANRLLRELLGLQK